MQSSASIAWRPGIGGDEIWIVTTNSLGSIIGYWAVAPDPLTHTYALQWNVEQIAGPNSAAATPWQRRLPSHSAGSGKLPFLPRRVCTSPRVDPTALFITLPSNSFPSLDRAMAQSKRFRRDRFRGRRHGNARRLRVNILTASDDEKLIGWLGNWDTPFVQMPIPTPAPHSGSRNDSTSGEPFGNRGACRRPATDPGRPQVMNLCISGQPIRRDPQLRRDPLGAWQSSPIPMPTRGARFVFPLFGPYRWRSVRTAR